VYSFLGRDVRRRVRLGADDGLGLDLVARGVEVEPLGTNSVTVSLMSNLQMVLKALVLSIQRKACCELIRVVSRPSLHASAPPG
jgi:hypothetical protein